ncbi:MAG: DUF434 domain-containing protein [Bilifractor sp.]|jgi:hypothetical protein
MKSTRRGWHEGDEKLFSEEEMEKLSLCAYEAAFLLERGYPLKSAVTVTGDRRLLSRRQRIALGRMTTCPSRKNLRKSKELEALDPGCTVHIDAFNAVIIMETALSHSLLLRCMDGCIRDLSGLAGNYSIITVTGEAIDRIIGKLKQHGVAKGVFHLDAPISNSGRLLSLIADEAEKLEFPIDFVMARDADYLLKQDDHVISADSEVIEACQSWYNLYSELVEEVPDPWIVELNPH